MGDLNRNYSYKPINTIKRETVSKPIVITKEVNPATKDFDQIHSEMEQQSKED